VVPTHTDDDVVIAFKPLLRLAVHTLRVILEVVESESAVTRQDDAGMLYAVTGIGYVKFSVYVTKYINIRKTIKR
jgi:hypothetical protein